MTNAKDGAAADVPRPRPRSLRLLVLSTLVVFGIATIDLSSAGAAPHDVVYAVTDRGAVLPPGSTVRPGQHLTVVALGFAPGARVQVVDAMRRIVRHVFADRHGTAHTSFVTPQRISRGRLALLALDGPVPAREAPLPPDTRHPRRRDPMTVQVVAPLLRKYPYRLPASSGIHAVIDLGNTAANRNSASLAGTGFDVIALVVVGVALVALGAFGTVLTRRGRG